MVVTAAVRSKPDRLRYSICNNAGISPVCQSLTCTTSSARLPSRAASITARLNRQNRSQVVRVVGPVLHVQSVSIKMMRAVDQQHLHVRSGQPALDQTGLEQLVAQPDFDESTGRFAGKRVRDQLPVVRQNQRHVVTPLGQSAGQSAGHVRQPAGLGVRNRFGRSQENVQYRIDRRKRVSVAEKIVEAGPTSNCRRMPILRSACVCIAGGDLLRLHVIPAKAGIQRRQFHLGNNAAAGDWIPAYAGTTRLRSTYNRDARPRALRSGRRLALDNLSNPSRPYSLQVVPALVSKLL